jgi:hypothetical protein
MIPNGFAGAGGFDFPTYSVGWIAGWEVDPPLVRPRLG